LANLAIPAVKLLISSLMEARNPTCPN